jgi:lipoyl(octanoyl) transferase
LKKQGELIEAYILEEKQPYFPMWDLQKEWVQEIGQNKRNQSLLLLEHEHVYTFGRGAHKEHLLISEDTCLEKGIELAEIDRGGDITYHGPGQLVGYPLLVLDRFQNNAHLYLRKLEETLIRTLSSFGIQAGRKEAYTGVWVKDLKIAAIGVKFNRVKGNKDFIASHGFAVNVNTDLSMFEHIIPCGIREYGVTSMEQLLGQKIEMNKIVEVYQSDFEQEFDVRLFHSNGYDKSE